MGEFYCANYTTIKKIRKDQKFQTPDLTVHWLQVIRVFLSTHAYLGKFIFS
jgi:hypothetical protein